jgi:hypothetical protein
MNKIKTTSSLTYPNFLRKTRKEKLINCSVCVSLGLAWITLLFLILGS